MHPPFVQALSAALLLLVTHGSLATAAQFVDDGNEPPINPFLGISLWPMMHRNPYSQGSTPWAGPTNPDNLAVDVTKTAPGSVVLCYSNPDENGNNVLWENNVLDTAKISGIDLKVIDKVTRINNPPLSGAYILLDIDNVLFAPKGRSLRAYTNAIPNDLFSDIVLKAEYSLPSSAFGSSSDAVVALNLLYDGRLVFVTAELVVGVIKRDFTDLVVLSLGHDEEVSNQAAVDENGGIYIVTSKSMLRVQWVSGTKDLSLKWSSSYKQGPDVQVGGRLGAGSGTTPTLMGTGDQDKFVVIADGEPLMNLVFFWRDDIPDDWVPIDPERPRIAAEVPVTFGFPNAETSVTEQSVLVRGYGALVVNNDYNFRVTFSGIFSILNLLLVYFTNFRKWAPFGVEKFEWDPVSRTLVSVWANTEISCPNGIPTMSVATNLAYCVGQRNAVWNIEALDWSTGKSVFFKPLGSENGIFKRLAAKGPKYNSAYAATQIGPNGEIVTGTGLGVLRVRIRH